jgi:hypothetical protein
MKLLSLNNKHTCHHFVAHSVYSDYTPTFQNTIILMFTTVMASYLHYFDVLL